MTKLPPEVEEAIDLAYRGYWGHDAQCERAAGEPCRCHRRFLKRTITAACEKAYAAGQAHGREQREVVAEQVAYTFSDPLREDWWHRPIC